MSNFAVRLGQPFPRYTEKEEAVCLSCRTET